MDIYLNNLPEANHIVEEPWPFVFQVSRLLAFIAFVVTLILRSKTPMLYFIWSVTVAVLVRFFAVVYVYDWQTITLTQWIWGVLGLLVVGSFWALKYGLVHRVKNW
jgi:hypothetical protein